MKRSVKLISVPVILIMILLSGCTTVSKDTSIVINKDKEQITYEFATVVRDDVVLEARVKAEYKQKDSQKVVFSNNGKIVTKVYVNDGDVVKKGDLLVELSSGNLENEIETLEYNIARNKLLLGYLDKKEYLDIQNQWVSCVFYSANTEQNQENTRKSVERIQKNYEKQRQSYRDSIEFDEIDLKNKKKELKQSRIYASIDGIVHDIKSGLKGSTSKKDEEIMTIFDNSEAFFESKAPEYASCFDPNETYSINITTSGFLGTFEIKPFDVENWGETQKFAIVNGPDNVTLGAGVYGTLKVSYEKRENVLALPVGTVYEADGKKFVYVVNENNMREIKWIETGLYSDSLIEIVSGLNEGDKVVKK